MSSINEATIFEYLREQAQQTGIPSIAIRHNESPYVAVYSASGQCGIGSTIQEAINQLPSRNQQVDELVSKADRLEKEATELRSKAAMMAEGTVDLKADYQKQQPFSGEVDHEQ